MAHMRTGRGKVSFGAPFFHCLNDQILMIQDYAYVGIDFKGGPDLQLPPGAQWGDIGKKQNPKMAIYDFVFFMCSNKT